MVYYRIDLHTIFDDCDYSLAFAFADDITDEEIADEFDAVFNGYMCAVVKLLGEPGSYTNPEEYNDILDYFLRSTDYDAHPITEEEFLIFENSDPVEI